LCGAAVVLALHAAQLPLVGSTFDNSAAGMGFWLALAAAVVSLVAAGMAATGARRSG